MKENKEECLFELNKLSGDYICYFPNAINPPKVFTSEKKALNYCKEVNQAFVDGQLKIIDEEIVKVSWKVT